MIMSDEAVAAPADFNDSLDTLKRTFTCVKNNAPVVFAVYTVHLLQQILKILIRVYLIGLGRLYQRINAAGSLCAIKCIAH